MRILRAHGIAASTIHVIFNAVVVAKLTYAASSWWGFTTAEDRQRLAAVIRRGIRSGLCDPWRGLGGAPAEIQFRAFLP